MHTPSSECAERRSYWRRARLLQVAHLGAARRGKKRVIGRCVHATQADDGIGPGPDESYMAA